MEELEITQVEVSEEPAEIVDTVEVAEATEVADSIEAEEIEAVAEEQAIEDATHDPGVRVEETQDFAQAEAVEVEVTEAMTEAESEITMEAEESIDVDNPESNPGDMDGQAKPDEPQAQVQDPLTGKGYGGQTQEPSGESGSDDFVLAETLDEVYDPQVQAEGLKSTQEAGRQAEGNDVDPGLIDGNDPVYQVDGESAVVGSAVGTQDGINQDATGEFDPQRLGPENLPQNERLPVGFGPNGALFPGGAKGFPGGQGGPPQGSSTNGGGPPVGNYGSGSKGNGGKKGKGKVTYWGVNDGMSFEGSSNDSCDKETVKQSKRSEITDNGNVIIDCGNGTQYQLYWENGGDIEVSKRGLTLDGGTPMPYTGNWSWGEDPDPDTPIGGLDREAGKVFPVIAGGGSDSGGKTPGDKDGEDDSGKFLGDPNLSGSDDYVPPPDDDIPYHNLNQYNAEI